MCEVERMVSECERCGCGRERMGDKWRKYVPYINWVNQSRVDVGMTLEG